MSVKRSKFLLLSIALFIVTSSYAQKSKKYVINGYVGGYNGRPVNVDAIDAKKLTHINYAFVDCADSMAILRNKNDSINFRQLNTLKKINPALKIMISIGGWTWSKNFSDAVLTPTSRALFAKTSVDIVRNFDLDGVDIDWEYPNSRGAGNKFRPEDKHNYTLMFEAIRKDLDILSASTGKKYELTAALGASKNFISNTEMAEVGRILDHLYIMTYDYGGPAGTVGHHNNLYAYGPNGGSSADQSIRDFIAAGVPAKKIGIGVAFYGKNSTAETTENNGLLQKRAAAAPPATATATPAPRPPGIPGGGGFTNLKENVIDKQGYVRHWDKDAQAPYLFNAENKMFVTYDDEKSTKLKAKYVKKHKLAGVFFWEYFSDPKGYLLDVLDKTLN